MVAAALILGGLTLGSSLISSYTTLKQTKMMMEASKQNNAMFAQMWQGQMSSAQQNMAFWQQQAMGSMGGQFGPAPYGYYPPYY